MLFNEALRVATLAARERLGDTRDSRVTTSVSNGAFNVERVTYDRRGNSTIRTLQAGLTMAEAIAFLNSLQRGCEDIDG